jgi:hypothetical protein
MLVDSSKMLVDDGVNHGFWNFAPPHPIGILGNLKKSELLLFLELKGNASGCIAEKCANNFRSRADSCIPADKMSKDPHQCERKS